METEVKYSLKVKSSLSDYELISNIYKLRFGNSFYPSIDYNDSYQTLEVTYYSSGGIYNAIEDTRFLKELLKGEEGVEFEINGVEDSDYGNFILFQIVYKDKDAIIRQIPFNIDSEYMDCTDLVFSVSGRLKYLENKESFIDFVDDLCGIYSESVSKDVNYLIVNDFNSNTKKVLKAKELGITLLSELDFIKATGLVDEFDIDENDLLDFKDYSYFESVAFSNLMKAKFESIDNCYCLWAVHPVDMTIVELLRDKLLIKK